jgi:two-component system sensor histidine kinase GlrK
MKFTIFKRMACGYALIMVMVIFMGIYVTLRLNQLTDLNYTIARVDGAAIQTGEHLLELIFSQVGFERKYLISRDQDFRKEFQRTEALFVEELERLRALADSDDEKKEIDNIVTLYNRYLVLFQEESVLLGKSEQSPGKEYLDEKEKIVGQISDTLRSLIQNARLKRDEKVGLSSNVSYRAIRVTVVTAALIIVLGITISFLITRSIARPISFLGQETKEIAKGRFHKITNIHSPPEIKHLAEDFNGMSERLEDLDKMKLDFISHVSHELRTPLTSIKAASSMALEGAFKNSPKDQNELLSVIRDECDRLIGAVNRVLDFSRMEARMMDYHFTDSELFPIIQRTILKLAPLAQRKRIGLELKPSSGLPRIKMDPDRIGQVIENLLGNALKFTSEGGKVVVAVAVRERDDGRAFVLVSFSDSGCGIRKEHLEQIFERFKRIDMGRETTMGTGLGLSIVKHIIAGHGGRIWVKSAPGKGSTFSFALPVASL